MGIRGFMTYIRRHPNLLKPYDLHGGYLIIDGHNLASKLYVSPGNTAFGGDYRCYPQIVETFFDDMERCAVKPLVIIGGGRDTIDLKKMSDDKKSKLKDIINYILVSKDCMLTLPFSITVVFKSVLRKKGIKIVRSLTSCHPHLAGIAKVLNCPVLTFDSKLFLCGVQCIPIDTLESGTVGNSWRTGYNVKRCKIFNPENLSKSFGNISPTMFPLLLILLDNSSTKSEECNFDEFFNCLKWTNQNERLYSEEQAKIETTFLWLQESGNLNAAVTALIEKIPKKHQGRVLSEVEAVINQYTNLSFDLLKTLGLTKEFEMATRANRPLRRFEFLRNVDRTEVDQAWRENETMDSESSSSEEETEEESRLETYNHLGQLNREIVDSWPSWFAEYYNAARSPTYFANLMLHRFYDVPFRAEDTEYPSLAEMSLKIVRVVDGLLVAGCKQSAVGLTILIRDGMTVVNRCVDTICGTKSTKFPELGKLRDTPMELRKRILDDTLEISGEAIDDIPSEWRLFIAATLFWMLQKDEPLRDSCHMRAVLLTMLLGVVHGRNDRQRSSERLGEKNGRTEALTVEDALRNVTAGDCVAAVPFFNSNYNIYWKLLRSPEDLNVTISHVFFQFAEVFHHAMALNDLLECPYESPRIEDLYNGTMLYNLYVQFAKEPNVDDYIASRLKNSPSILHLLGLLTERVTKILEARAKA